MHKARVALNEAYKFLSDAEGSIERMPGVTEAIKKLKSDILFLLAIIENVDGIVIKFPGAGRAN